MSKIAERAASLGITPEVYREILDEQNALLRDGPPWGTTNDPTIPLPSYLARAEGAPVVAWSPKDPARWGLGHLVRSAPRSVVGSAAHEPLLWAGYTGKAGKKRLTRTLALTPRGNLRLDLRSVAGRSLAYAWWQATIPPEIAAARLTGAEVIRYMSYARQIRAAVARLEPVDGTPKGADPVCDFAGLCRRATTSKVASHNAGNGGSDDP